MINLHPVLGYTDMADTLKEWDLGYSFIVKGNSPFSGSIVNKSDVKLLKEYGHDRVALTYQSGIEFEAVVLSTVEVKL